MSILPCIVVAKNNNPNDDSPHGQIIALYPENAEELWGDLFLDQMLAVYINGSKGLYEYVIDKIDTEHIIYSGIGCASCYHPRYVNVDQFVKSEVMYDVET